MEITSHDSCISMDRIKGGGARRTAGAVIKLLMRALKHNRARNSAWPTNDWSAYFRHQDTGRTANVTAPCRTDANYNELM